MNADFLPLAELVRLRARTIHEINASMTPAEAAKWLLDGGALLWPTKFDSATTRLGWVPVHRLGTAVPSMLAVSRRIRDKNLCVYVGPCGGRLFALATCDDSRALPPVAMAITQQLRVCRWGLQ